MRPITLHPGSCLFLEQRWHAYGSLGLPVRDRRGEVCLLTAAHVVGGMAPDGPRTDRVCTSYFSRPVPTLQLWVGQVVERCPPAPVRTCVVDAALIMPAPGVEGTRQVAPGFEATGVACELDLDAMMDRPVLKTGCVSGLTTGVICAVGSSVMIQSVAGVVRYECVYEVMSDRDGCAFAQPGDSGAVVVDARGWVVGLVVAMQLPTDDPSSMAYVVPIDLITQELGVRLIGPR